MLINTLTSHGVTRSELYLAWDFTTQSSDSVAGRLLHMRDDAFTILGASAPSFTVDTVTEPLDANIFREIDGTFQVDDQQVEVARPVADGERGIDRSVANVGLAERCAEQIGGDPRHCRGV